MEVVYTGLHQTPEMIATAAVQEDVDVVGLSILSGAHMTLFPRVRQLLDAMGRPDILVTGGGIIPAEDMAALQQQGIGKLFGPGTPTSDLIEYIESWAAEHLEPERARDRPPVGAGSGSSPTSTAGSPSDCAQGGGAARVAKMHEQGKLAPRERVQRLLDPGTPWLELGLLVAYDQYDGPGARRRRHHRRRRGRGARGRGGGERRHGEGGLLVAGDDPEDPPRPGSRDAAADPDRLSGGQRRGEPAVPGRGLSRASTAPPGSSTTTRSCGGTCTCRRSAR